MGILRFARRALVFSGLTTALTSIPIGAAAGPQHVAKAAEAIKCLLNENGLSTLAASIERIAANIKPNAAMTAALDFKTGIGVSEFPGSKLSPAVAQKFYDAGKASSSFPTVAPIRALSSGSGGAAEMGQKAHESLLTSIITDTLQVNMALGESEAPLTLGGIFSIGPGRAASNPPHVDIATDPYARIVRTQVTNDANLTRYDATGKIGKEGRSNGYYPSVSEDVLTQGKKGNALFITTIGRETAASAPGIRPPDNPLNATVHAGPKGTGAADRVTTVINLDPLPQ